jgi:RNA polymerase-binding transcription factor DksA
MPAKKSKPAAKKAAKPAKKPAAPKPAKKPTASKPKSAGKSKSKPVPAKKPAPKKTAPKKPAPKPVKKAPAKPAKKVSAKKPVSKKTAPAKKPAKPAKKPAPVKAVKAAKPAAKAPAAKTPAKPAPAPKAVVPVAAPAPKVSKSKGPAPLTIAKARTGPATGTPRRPVREEEGATIDIIKGPVKMTPFLKKQKQNLVELRDAYLHSIQGAASIAMGGEEASAFGMHQADAGSDAYDRDFALSMLGKEQDALYEINEALKRIETGTYGLCEGTGTRISEERLEAMPFARFSIVWQEKVEREQRRGGWNRPVHSLFGLDDTSEKEDDDKDEDEAPTSTAGNNNAESLDFSKE